MHISKKCYQGLTPKQRAIAAYHALNREDHAEVDRLIKNAPKDGKQGQAILAIGQARDVYNLMLAKKTKDFLVAYGESKEAKSFCDGWIAAGGALDNKAYHEKRAISKSLIPIVEQLASEITAVHQATREWCQNNEIPVETFSGLCCFVPLRPADMDSDVDSEMLNIVRDLYDGITLSW